MEKTEIDSLIAALEQAAINTATTKTNHTPNKPNSYEVIANDIIEHHIDQYKSMIPFILEMKVQVDRWDLVVKKWFIHSLIKPFILHNLKSHISEALNNGQIEYSLWGAEVIFTPDTQIDKIIAIDSDNTSYDDMRYACLGKLDLSGIQRLLDMKAFW